MKRLASATVSSSLPRRCRIMLLVPLLALVPVGCSAPHAAAPCAAECAIRRVLREQADQWNRGDIDGFMGSYWRSDELTFSAAGRTTRGWVATRERYQRRYPDRRAMGTLAFSELEVTVLAPEAALVLGRWHLDRDERPVGGNFSLVFRRMGNRWLIVHDHTSVLPDDRPGHRHAPRDGAQ